MNNGFLLLALFSVVIASFSQVMLKLGAGKTYNSKIREYLNIYVISGYGMLFVSMIITVVAYSRLSYLSVPVVEAGNICDPFCIWSVRMELSIQQIFVSVYLLAQIYPLSAATYL